MLKNKSNLIERWGGVREVEIILSPGQPAATIIAIFSFQIKKQPAILLEVTWSMKDGAHCLNAKLSVAIAVDVTRRTYLWHRML